MGNVDLSQPQHVITWEVGSRAVGFAIHLLEQ